MKKILHISNYLYPHIGGIEQVARDIINALNTRYEQKLICFNHEKGTKVDYVDGIEVTRASCIAKVASQSISLSYKKILKKLMREYNPDIVLFHYPNPLVAHYLLKYKKKNNFRLILYWHLDITKQKILGKIFHKQNLKLLKWATSIVATSPNYIEGSPYLSQYKEKCMVIPCCVNTARLKYDEIHIRRKEEIKRKYADKNICFAFGRHVEYKGLKYLVQASRLLPDNYAVLIGGKGPLTKTLIEEAKNDSKVEFLGRISDEDLKAYLLACDVFCFPSITKNEAFGIGLAEAMYYGNSCVTFNILGSGVNYVNINGDTGLEVENRNVEAYAKAIMEIINNKHLNETFQANAKKRVDDLFVQDKFDSNIVKLLEITCGGNNEKYIN